MDYNPKYVLEKPEEVDLKKAIGTLNWFITGYPDSTHTSSLAFVRWP